jgi:hypothetical protein
MSIAFEGSDVSVKLTRFRGHPCKSTVRTVRDGARQAPDLVDRAVAETPHFLSREVRSGVAMCLDNKSSTRFWISDVYWLGALVITCGKKVRMGSNPTGLELRLRSQDNPPSRTGS